MSGFVVGIAVGTFLGIGITFLYLLHSREQQPAYAELWIDEALENAIRAVERKY